MNRDSSPEVTMAGDTPRPGADAAEPDRGNAADRVGPDLSDPGSASQADSRRRDALGRRPSLGGGTPAQQRELGTMGRLTVRKLLDAGLAEFDEKGFQAVRVDDVVRRAKTSHGTFYLYFSNKDDLFRTLLLDALHDMEIVTEEFPVVTSNEAGRVALRKWIQRFTDTYADNATVIRILSQADIVGEEVYGDGLRLLFRLSEAIAQGMTAAASRGERAANTGQAQHAELTALACLMMLERVNYLLSVEVRLPREEMIDRLSAIIYAAFQAS
ncbi:MAG TPA: helix-turn-helix domain-containing protein [Streptosporangiaceae bacterium]